MGSNRTFMELKLPNVLCDTHTKNSSNRTFMELKCPKLIVIWKQQKVLIVPLWN